jgi:glycosyltransferase involved in cell wall biosynthesis
VQIFSLYFEVKTALVEALLQQEWIKPYEKVPKIKRLFVKKKLPADIVVFHSSMNKKEHAWLLQQAKLVIAPCNSSVYTIIQEFLVSPENIEVVYSTFTPQEIDIKAVKKAFKEQTNINKESKIILFTATDLKQAGSKAFIQIIQSLQSSDFRVIIASSKQQIHNLKFQIAKFNFGEQVLLYEDFENIDELFAASDIFVLPTLKQGFSSDVAKAMYYKCAVFVPSSNASSEIVDVFSCMNSFDDGTTAFKIDALLSRSSDLKVIQKQNRKIAKELLLEKAVEKIEQRVEILNKS